jgi:PD-(D/E)XK endonuclease
MKAMPTKRPPLTHVKEKGEWGEIAFQAKALALGLSVAKPNGDNQPFDFIVTNQAGGMFRVQVKSGWAKDRVGYPIRCQWRNRGFGDSAQDLFAVYIAPHDAWYIFPANVMGPNQFPRFYPHMPPNYGPNEKWRNRWSLLTGDPLDDTREVGLTIHAAADPGSKK